jgi:uncharacterized protein
MAERPFPSYWMYRDSQNKWRWRYDARNGETISVSSESYNARRDCERGIQIMKESANSPIWMPTSDVDAQ